VAAAGRREVKIDLNDIHPMLSGTEVALLSRGATSDAARSYARRTGLDERAAYRVMQRAISQGDDEPPCDEPAPRLVLPARRWRLEAQSKRAVYYVLMTGTGKDRESFSLGYVTRAEAERALVAIHHEDTADECASLRKLAASVWGVPRAENPAVRRLCR
jgi:hypothetical protein